MTIERISFRDFIRGYTPADVLMLLDKKSKSTKGLFVSPKYAEDVLAFLEKKEKQIKKRKKDALLDFVGEFGDGDKTTSHQAIKAEKYE